MGKTTYSFTSYQLLVKQAAALLEEESDPIANMANLAALLYWTLPEVNWAGFYRLKNNNLLLGPFMGQPACVRLSLGSGVCGTSAALRKTIIVPDVHDFEGHIACDAVSRSEIVIPLVRGGALYGVLDLDSPVVNRFDDECGKALEEIAEMFLTVSNLESGLK